MSGPQHGGEDSWLEKPLGGANCPSRPNKIKTVPAGDFEEHGADQGHPSVYWGAAEAVSGLQGQRYVLNHFGQKLEVVQVVERIQVVVLQKKRQTRCVFSQGCRTENKYVPFL